MTTAQAAISLNAEQQRAARAPIGPTLVSGRARLRQDPGGHSPHRMADQQPIRPAREHPGIHLHQPRSPGTPATTRRHPAPRTAPTGMFAGTFHSWGARFLRQHAHLAQPGPQAFTICDQQESDAILNQAMPSPRYPATGNQEQQPGHPVGSGKPSASWKSESKSPEDRPETVAGSDQPTPSHRMPRRAPGKRWATRRYQELMQAEQPRGLRRPHRHAPPKYCSQHPDTLQEVTQELTSSTSWLTSTRTRAATNISS